VSALQSRVFNEVVARRVESLDRLMDGDLAWRHEGGAVFRVAQASVEQPRCDSFEISPSGPLIGSRTTMPDGEPLRIEREAFAAAGLDTADFRGKALGKVKGARRPLRVKPQDVHLAGGVDEHGPHVTIAFTLPPGSFATVLLRELMKKEPDGRDEADQPEMHGDAHEEAHVDVQVNEHAGPEEESESNPSESESDPSEPEPVADDA
jgi:tRNA pseudouridine13 synthase